MLSYKEQHYWMPGSTKVKELRERIENQCGNCIRKGLRTVCIMVIRKILSRNRVPIKLGMLRLIRFMTFRLYFTIREKRNDTTPSTRFFGRFSGSDRYCLLLPNIPKSGEVTGGTINDPRNNEGNAFP